jgi:hypothetical protein
VNWQHDGTRGARPRTGDMATLASDADRDAAVRMLSEAFAEGRLTSDEHGERVQAAYAGRTWQELARLTADVPGPEDAAVRPQPSMPDGLDRCLLCALLIVCPPAGIAWLLTARHRSRAGQRHALTAAAGPSRVLPDGARLPAGNG